MKVTHGKRAILDEHRNFAFDSAPLPSPDSGEVLVQISLATVCKSDWHTWCGHRDSPLPSVLGHEATGTVVALPAEPIFDVNQQLIQLGDQLVWSVFAVPEEDSLREKWMVQKTPGVRKYGHLALSVAPFSGGFATHILLEKGTCIARLDAAIPPAVAAPLNCSLATMVGAFRLAGELLPSSVAILGCGMLGLHGLAYAKTLGIRRITGIDHQSVRLEKAVAFGADQAMSFEAFLASRDTWELILDTTGATAAMEASIEKLSLGGTAIWVGAVFPSQPVAVNPEKVIRNLLTIKGLHNYNETDFRRAVAYLQRYYRDFPFETLVNPILSLEELPTAFEWYRLPQTYRAGIQPG